MKFETVIPVAEKDICKLPFVIKSITTYTDTTGIHIITSIPERVDVESTLPVVTHHDDEILPFDRSRFRYRPNWCMQQFLKMFQDVTSTNWFLVIDCDRMFAKHIDFFDGEKPVFILGNGIPTMDQYWEFNKAMLNLDYRYPHSFLSECTMYSRYLVREMLRWGGYSSPLDFVTRASRVITDDIPDSIFPADAELYGNWVSHVHPDLYVYRKVKDILGGRYYPDTWNEDDIVKRIAEMEKQDIDMYSIHSWGL